MVVNADAGWDLAINNRNGQLTLVVEVKNKIGVSPEWAASLRRNLLAHDTLPTAPYLLIAFPDTFYLWTDHETSLEAIAPDYSVDARGIIQPYLERAGFTADQISGQSLELIVSAWLGELLYAETLSEEGNDYRWLIDSGLLAAISGGRFAQEVAA
jgi:hypothetical protein